MTTHIFIVTDNTFKTHLSYMFAGTGAGEEGHENIGMISDISGCKVGDKVIFYLTQNSKEKRDGQFFGVFEISSTAFWQEKGLYLKDELKKPLTNRVLIKPYKVFPKGISEWDALDNLENLPNGEASKVNDLIWSLIYRKLEGNRGCTPIFNYESEQLVELINKENKGIVLSNSKNYDFKNNEICILNNNITYDLTKITIKDYIPLQDYEKNTYSVEEKIVKVKEGSFKKTTTTKKKIFTQHKCEAELEYFFISKLGEDKRVNEITGSFGELNFWGSQIFCGVGKRRIDILTILKNSELRLIELKDEGFNNYQLDQISRYIKWSKQYIREPYNKIIQPILVIADFPRETSEIIKFNEEMNCKNIKIFKWSVKDNNKIIFEEFIYG